MVEQSTPEPVGCACGADDRWKVELSGDDRGMRGKTRMAQTEWSTAGSQ